MKIQAFLRLLNWFWAIQEILNDEDGNYGCYTEKGYRILEYQAVDIQKRIDEIFTANDVEPMQIEIQKYQRKIYWQMFKHQ